MAAKRRMLLLVIVTAISAQLTSAQQPKEVTITEPGIFDLSGLFKHADAVALVRIVAGDTEAYSTAVYKAEVVKGFKGAATGEIVYFGPYLGERLGWEYIVFLRNVSEPIKPKAAQNAGYGTIRYAEIFNEGYSSMETSYECLFDGREPAQKMRLRSESLHGLHKASQCDADFSSRGRRNSVWLPSRQEDGFYFPA